jgi:hypothetical protein
MQLLAIIFGLAAQAVFNSAAPLQVQRSNSNVTNVGTQVDYYEPAKLGGSMLDKATETAGEPLNVIISGKSSPAVLTKDGIVNYARAIGFSSECLGLHIGKPQTANLGDGNGDVPQMIELRQAYGVVSIGSCWESLVGGNHFRVFQQNGPKANSGAMFLAASREMDSPIHHHDIVPNGYDLGRDQLVQGAVGVHKYGKVTYNTTVTNITTLIPPGANGINHNITLDGMVALLTVQII